MQSARETVRAGARFLLGRLTFTYITGALREAEYVRRCIELSYVVHFCRRRHALLRSMRLLVVEDNEELAQLLAQRLQTAGYETDLLTTAAEALAAVTTTRYAAMVLDLG